MAKSASERLRADRLKEACERAGIDSDAELGRRVGADGSTISRWKKGTASPTLDNVDGLQRTLGVSIGYLMGRDESPEDRRAYLVAQLRHEYGIAIAQALEALASLDSQKRSLVAKWSADTASLFRMLQEEQVEQRAVVSEELAATRPASNEVGTATGAGGSTSSPTAAPGLPSHR